MSKYMQVIRWGRYMIGSLGVLILLGGCAAKKIEQAEAPPLKTESAPAVAKISQIRADTLAGKIRITIDANTELTYTAFKLTDPLRLVLDLPNTDTTQVSEVSFTDQAPLLKVTPFQFAESGNINSRIEIALSQLVPYQVLSDANRLFVDLEAPAATTRPAVTAQASPQSLPPGFEELTPAPGITPVVMAAQPSKTQTERPQIVPVQAPAEQAAAPTIEIVPPPQNVGDVKTMSQILATSEGVAVIKNFEITEMEGKTRIIVSTDITPAFEVMRSETPPRLTIDLKQSDLPPNREKVLTPEAADTLVKQARLFQLRRTPDGKDNVARILVDLLQPAKHEVATEPGKLIVDVVHPALSLTETPAREGESIAEVPLTTGIEEALKSGETKEETTTATAPAIRSPKTGEEKEYKGQLISIQFQSAPILDVLDVIAEVSGLNLVVHPGVAGNVTVRLSNIPWDQALDIVLKMNNLAVEIEGNILRIAPASVFQNEVAQRVQQQRQQIEALRVQEELEPLETKLINVNFAEPGVIVGIITSYFSGQQSTTTTQQRRGTITLDARTKTLIVQDTAANIKKIEEIVATLDRRTPQVMIEARVVSINTSFRKELGINWSGSFSASPATGNPLSYRFPYTVDIPDFGVNLPSVGSPIGTTGAIRLGSIDDIISIFARIDAAEEDFKAKTLSQPKIFTQDNVGASVSSTQTQYVAVGGDSQTPATIQPVSAALSLNVTPRISRDGFITMQVTVSNGSVATGSGGTTETSTQSVNSQVTVKDGETVVIGGIYSTGEQKNFTGVPYLHRIPVLGWLFKSNLPNAQSQSELLVFLTPRILDRSILKPEEGGTNVSLSY